jgi:hypothetical protein
MACFSSDISLLLACSAIGASARRMREGGREKGREGGREEGREGEERDKREPVRVRAYMCAPCDWRLVLQPPD